MNFCRSNACQLPREDVTCGHGLWQVEFKRMSGEMGWSRSFVSLLFLVVLEPGRAAKASPTVFASELLGRAVGPTSRVYFLCFLPLLTPAGGQALGWDSLTHR